MKKNNQRLTILFSLVLVGALITVLAVEDVTLTTPDGAVESTAAQTDAQELMVEEGVSVTNPQEAVTEQTESAATSPQEPVSETRPPLATIVGSKSIDSDTYAREYLQLRGFFDNLPFETVNGESSVIFNAGNTPEDVKGFVFNNRLYAIHLVLCTEEHQSCYFRVNGMPTDRITTKDSDVEGAAKFFTLDENYRLEVNSIQFNYCGTYRFCDMRHEAYDLVNVSIISANEE